VRKEGYNWIYSSNYRGDWYLLLEDSTGQKM